MFEYAYLWTVRYYDGKGREIRTVWKSHLGIGYETEDRDYAFSGEVTERRLTHVDATGQNMTERYTYSYDDWGRPLTVHHQLGAAPSVSLHAYSYDGLGRLCGDNRNGVAGLGTVYSYNVRSWLTESATGVSGGTFRERLSYGESQVDGTPNTPRWGGDVSRVSSCATGDASAHHYRLGYDGQGRLVSAAYGGGPSGSNYSAQFSYDSHGNVLTSSRSRIGGGSGAELGVTELTSFQYTGNQLTGRLAELQLEDIPVGPLEPGLEPGLEPEPGDSLIRPLGLVAEPSGELLEVVGEEVVEEEIVPVEDMQEVFYDRCGRVVGDPGSGIQSVEYNELSLPSRVTFTGVRAPLGSDRYGLQYVASGRKLRTGALVDLEMGIAIEGEGVDPEAHGPSAVMQQVVPERAEVFMNERDYVGNLVYQGGVLDKILIDGGYINASDGSYHFFVTDRLGNVRVVANAGGGAEQVNHYDPYGASLSLAGVPDTSGNSYKWGGKEWDKTLYRYDFGARLYSPSDLRWRTMDPLCEKYYSLSPYAYCANNPMNLVDPSGENPIFSTTGSFLGVDDLGLQGSYIVMLPEYYKPGMPHEVSTAYNLGDIGLEDEDARMRMLETFYLLCERPDWDGYLTLKEANEWYRVGGGKTLYTELSRIDISGVYYWGENTIGDSKVVSLFSASNSINDGLVYGRITLKTVSERTVKAYSDKYNFDMKPWRYPNYWGRNIATMIGRSVAGDGTPFEIVIYGSSQVSSFFPWVK